MPYTADELKGERIRRALAAKRLKDFTKYTFPNYKYAKHQDALDEKLESVERFIVSEGREGCGRLIVTMPPRHGKSEKVSIRFPAWFLGRNPDKRVMLCSYGAELAEDFSKKVRDLVESTEFRNVFADTTVQEDPVLVDAEKRRVQAWDIAGKRGGLVAAGVGGAITGRGADLLIIDDPVKDREEADSEAIQKKVWEWFTSTAYTRLQKGGAVIIMMTRWNENDLIGKILEAQGEKWEILNLPAIAEDNDPIGRIPGQPLWPDVFGEKELNDIKQTVSPRDWTSLYQQRPTAGSGEVFKREWLRYIPMPQKEDMNRGIQVWDTAFTEKEENDYCSCATLYVTRDGIFVANIFRAHLNFPQLKERMCDQWYYWNNQFPISRVYIEQKASGLSVLQSLRRDTHLPVMELEKDSMLGKSKLTRAHAAAGYIQAGRVSFLVNASWQSDFEDELFSFPRGKHDDMVDALVYGIITLNGGGKPPRRRGDSPGLRRGGDRLSSLVGAWGE